jgi:hypothetical protein
MPLFMHSLQASPSSSLSGPTEKREAKREKKNKKGKEKKKSLSGPAHPTYSRGPWRPTGVSCRDYHLPPWTDRAAPDPFMATSLLAEGGSS